MYVYQIVRVDQKEIADSYQSGIYTTPEAAVAELERMGFEVDPNVWFDGEPAAWVTDEKKNWPCSDEVRIYNTYTHFHIFREELQE